MTITIQLAGTSSRAVDETFDGVIDLRQWDDYVGVSMRGPARPVAAGDLVDVAFSVGRITIRCGMRVDVLTPPRGGEPGDVVVRSVTGPVDGELHARVRPTATGAELAIEVTGVTRGAARLVERPLEAVARQWLAHQLDHLLRLVDAAG